MHSDPHCAVAATVREWFLEGEWPVVPIVELGHRPSKVETSPFSDVQCDNCENSSFVENLLL